MQNEHQLMEALRCKANPIYFMKNYAKIRHPVNGLMPFELWDFQEDVVKSFLENDFNIILKARQLGISTLCSGYIAWFSIFNRDREIYVLATKLEVAINLVAKIKVIIENLPDWLKPTITIDNRKSLEFSNGSKIKASATTRDGIRSESLSLLVIDEAGFINNMDDIWTSARPTLSAGGSKCIALSSPNGVGNWFHDQWGKAIANEMEGGDGKFSFNPIKLHWSLHPDRDQEWAENTKKTMSIKQWSQEYDADFLMSGDNVITYDILKRYRDEEMIIPPKERTGVDGNFWIWKHQDAGVKYLVSADVARGDGADYSAFHVIDLDNYEQVAEYKGHIPTDQFGQFLVEVSTKYNQALLTIENNSYGWAVIQKVLELEYRNLFWSKKRSGITHNPTEKDYAIDMWGDRKNMVAGFTTSTSTRPAIIIKMEEDLRNFDFIFHSERLFTEFQTFIYENGKPQAMKGKNDDLILSLSIGMFVSGQTKDIKESNKRTVSMLQNFGQNQTNFDLNNGFKSYSKQENPFLKEVSPNHKEDLRWLI